jgi:PAS domain S-box-containing protein
MTSLAGEIKMANPAFSRVSGFSFEELAGKTALELGFWKHSSDRDLALKKILKHKALDNLELVYHGKDNNEERIWKLSSRIIDYEGEQLILSIILDITGQRNIEKSLRELDLAKDEFISVAAHELNTPLLAILGFAELLEQSEMIQSTEHQEYISMIISNAEILRNLVRALLDAEKIHLNQKLIIRPSRVDFNSFLKKSIRTISTEYPTHNFILTHLNELPEYVDLDKLRMTQVFINILSNAAKFSPIDKTIEITTETNKGVVVVSFIDHGIGMADEDVEKIFDKFHRAHANSSKAGGLGLGMYIVKNIIEAHGGNISVHSKETHGTTVRLSIPRECLKKTQNC